MLVVRQGEKKSVFRAGSWFRVKCLVKPNSVSFRNDSFCAYSTSSWFRVKCLIKPNSVSFRNDSFCAYSTGSWFSVKCLVKPNSFSFRNVSFYAYRQWHCSKCNGSYRRHSAPVILAASRCGIQLSCAYREDSNQSTHPHNLTSGLVLKKKLDKRTPIEDSDQTAWICADPDCSVRYFFFFFFGGGGGGVCFVF